MDWQSIVNFWSKPLNQKTSDIGETKMAEYENTGVAGDQMRVRVTRTVNIHPDQTVNVHYEAGWEGVAPRAHIEQLVACGAGVQIDASGKEIQYAPPAPVNARVG
jgi:hypothetical protein